MAKICGIYKITSPTGGIYIGQSVNVMKRLISYQQVKCKSQRKLYFSLLKHGSINHTFNVIHTCSRDKLNEFEIFYINKFDTFNTKHGLNLHSGGNSHIASDETKLKMSITNKGRAPSNKGVPRTQETILKLREAFKERKRKMRLTDGITEYQCTKCLKYLLSDKFYPKKNSPTLFNPVCKGCFAVVYYTKSSRKRLTIEEEQAIIDLFKNGQGQTAIAKKYNLWQNSIRRVLLKNKII